MPQDEREALRWLAEHPERQEVRLVVAVLRDGSRSAALRMRAHDDETSVLTGRDLVPGLADALRRHAGGLSDAGPASSAAGRRSRPAAQVVERCDGVVQRVDLHQPQPVGHRRPGLGAVLGRRRGTPWRRCAGRRSSSAVMPPIAPTLPVVVDRPGAGDELAAGQRPGRQLVDDAQREHQPGARAADVLQRDLDLERVVRLVAGARRRSTVRPSSAAAPSSPTGRCLPSRRTTRCSVSPGLWR